MNPAADLSSEQLSELTAVAYRLGLSFGAEAEQAQTWARKLECVDLFERCFFAVRVATALRLRLARGPAQAGGAVRLAAQPPAAPERTTPELERAERIEGAEPALAAYDERDREADRESEAAATPHLLRTLRGVAADAAALPAPPADLPKLRHVLAAVTAERPAPAFPRAPLRDRLSMSGSVGPVMVPAEPRPGALLPSALRRTTGPPRR